MWAKKLAESIVKGLQTAWSILHSPVPIWLKNLCTAIGEIVFMLLKEAGKDYISLIEQKIIATKADYPTMSNDEKFSLVWDFAHLLLPSWKESDLDGLIQSLFMKLKSWGKV